MTLENKDKIIKFFDRQNIYSTDAEGTNLGIVVDTETTGLEDDSEITEICILPFAFTDDFKITKVYKPYVGFEQPSKPLSEKIKSLTGMNDEMLEGKHFEDHSVTSLFNKADVAIAHNAKFDRSKMEKRFPSLKKIVWGCSANDPDWGSLNISSKVLDYIAFRLGFWFEHHRAENDCRATLHALSFPLKDGKTAFQSLLEKAYTPEIVLYANVGFNYKDIVKSNGFYWDGKSKRWFFKPKDEEEKNRILYFLKEKCGNPDVEEVEIPITRRFI
jgi:DNA polymerase-3 subunit epsilon